MLQFVYIYEDQLRTIKEPMEQKSRLKTILPIVFCLGLLVYGIYACITLVTSIAADVRTKQDLVSMGNTTTATVTTTATEFHVRRSEFSYELYFITYAFTPEVQTGVQQTAVQSKQAVRKTTFSSLTKGSTVEVRYVSSTPTINAPLSELNTLAPQLKQSMLMTLYIALVIAGAVPTVLIGNRLVRKKRTSYQVAVVTTISGILIVGGYYVAILLTDAIETILF